MARRDKTEVSCCIKYFMFGFNVVFWLLGMLVLGIGLYAWVDKGTFSKLSELSDSIFFDPALIFIIFGAVVFIIAFIGCIGSLRENTLFLLFYIVFLSFILVAIAGVAIYAFIDQEKTKDFVKDSFLKTVVRYRDDDDLKDIIDWTQQDWLHCCGVETIDDWEKNIYFNCSSPSVERCGVPSSCCLPVEGEALRNTFCGFGVRDPDIEVNPASKVYTEGCYDQFTAWINRNLIPIAGTGVAVAMVLILGICFAQNLRSDIFAQKAKWETSN